jgi:hypothetical protein
MVISMLDPHFKGMDCIMDYIGRDQATMLLQQYDELVVMPLLKVVMGFLNPYQAASLVVPSSVLLLTSTGLFGPTISTQKATKGLLKVKLFLFCMFNVENVDGL